METYWIIVCCIIVVLLFILARKRKKIPLPGPPGLPILGHLLDVLKNPNNLHSQLEKWKQIHGDIYEIYAINQRIVSQLN